MLIPQRHREASHQGMLGERDGITGTRSHHALLDSYQGSYQGEVYLVLADLDDFHLVNECNGYDGGNEVLHAVGHLIASEYGDERTFRYGSDEFVFACTAQTEEELVEGLNNLNQRLSKLEVHQRPVGVTCSFGYVHGTIEDANDLHEALRMADRQMFEAKRQGKACAAGTALVQRGGHEAGKAGSYKTYEADELTGLANMAHFQNELARAMEEKAQGDSQAVVHFNVQNFKGYNEVFGFDAGDELLVLIGSAITHAFPNCPAARTSADQFLVATTEEHALAGIKEVRSTFRHHVKDSSIWLKAGLYVVDDETTDIGVICDRAKLACDTIKGRRDVYYRVYDNELRQRIAMRHYVLDHFEEALEKNYIKVYYQPIVHVATGEVCDEEALARWEDPNRGIIFPDQFIPVLEEARLIHRLDLFIVRRSCENMRRRLKRGTVKDVPAVSVNLSRLDFELCDIVTEIEKILVYYDVPRSYVSVEVTESALTGNQEFLKGEIDRFRADGFEVWMDDFGSGYSSLNLLKEYAFDLVKLDMGFLKGFEVNDNSRILLANVINLAKELGIKTLVEGVETKEQLQFLKGVGCGKAQGYLFAKPQSLQMLMRSIATGVYPPIEPVKERAFFGKLARVNLMRPDPMQAINGHYVTSDVPAAILLRQDGTWSYLNATDVFRDYLRSIGSATLEESAAHLNDLMHPEHLHLESTLNRALESGGWETFLLGGDEQRPIRIKVIADDTQFDSTAVLAIAS